MHVVSAKLRFHIPQAMSLKDKRQVKNSLIDKTRRRFNVSIAEVDTQEMHQSLTIGIALVSGEAFHARQALDEVIRFMDASPEAQRIDLEWMD